MARTAPARPKPAKESAMMRTLGVERLNRIDPEEDFSDVDGDPANDFALVNEDPTRSYCWVRNHPDDVGEYKGSVVPYVIERADPDGVSVRMAPDQTKGEAIVKRGHVLMSCDKELWQKRNRYQFAQTQRANDLMFKRKQRDLDLRREGWRDLEEAS